VGFVWRGVGWRGGGVFVLGGGGGVACGGGGTSVGKILSSAIFLGLSRCVCMLMLCDYAPICVCVMCLCVSVRGVLCVCEILCFENLRAPALWLMIHHTQYTKREILYTI